MTLASDKIPVTVLTGFLGAGKTTLLNALLTQNHGKKFAVIVNEFGEIGIDNDLIVTADEEIFEMSNGCVCCTVRGDLIRVLSGLVRRAARFDGIILETTGLADPAPVAQTFFSDQEIADRVKLDSVICLADALHLPEQLKSGPEPEQQIGFADVILLTKTDCVSEESAHRTEHLIRHINPQAKLIRAVRGDVPWETLLGQGGFDLEKVAQTTLAAPEPEKTDSTCSCGCSCGCGHAQHDHTAPAHHAAFHHDSAIASISLSTDKPIDLKKLRIWLSELATNKGPDLLRYKGIFNLANEDRRFVIQGVHMMMEGGPISPWPEGAKRESRMVLIGRKLDKNDLQEAFLLCAD